MTRTLLTFFIGVGALFAQATPPFSFRFQQGQNVTILSDGGTVTLPADAVGAPVSGNLSIQYRGATGSTVQINSADLTGSLDFQVTGFAGTAFNVTGGETITAGIRYTPSTANRTTARLVVNYTENRVTNSFSVNLVGVAPDFAFSYTPPGGNAQPLLSGGAIRFPETVVDTTANATLSIVNRGSGNGTLRAVTSTGSAFALVGAPLPNTVVEANREVRVGIAFTPRQTAASTGTVNVEAGSQQVSFALEGTGATSQFVYEVLSEAGAELIQPEQLISLPEVAVGERASITVRVRNAGNADGRIAAVGASGTGITVSDVPPLPVVLQPGNRFSFTITFSPTQAGRVNGRLRVGNDQFDLTANGLGPILSYESVVSGVASTVLNNGSVNFVPTSVGANSTLQFRVTNTGTAQGSVNSVSITTANSAFELVGLPGLPATLGPGASLTVGVRFTPTTVGAATATLRVDGNTFTLNGAGTNPAPLPGYRFEGATGTVEPLQQPSISLTLAEPYPLALTGTLTLAFNSDVFANDPAVQFATGGRTVSFTVPANTTRVLFPNSATQIRLQTGTLAGTISLTPSFATEGGINLTPTRPDSLNLTVQPATPRLLGVSVSAKTATGVTLLVSGYSTSRTVTQMELRITPVSGENVGTTQLSLNVEPAFLAWFQSQQSQAFGGLFTATVPLTLTGDVTNVTNPSDTVRSIAVTVSNQRGASNSVSVNVN